GHAAGVCGDLEDIPARRKRLLEVGARGERVVFPARGRVLKHLLCARVRSRFRRANLRVLLTSSSDAHFPFLDRLAAGRAATGRLFETRAPVDEGPALVADVDDGTPARVVFLREEAG